MSLPNLARIVVLVGFAHLLWRAVRVMATYYRHTHQGVGTPEQLGVKQLLYGHIWQISASYVLFIILASAETVQRVITHEGFIALLPLKFLAVLAGESALNLIAAHQKVKEHG